MKKLLLSVVIVGIFVFISSYAGALECVSIQDGTILAEEVPGEPLVVVEVGYDDWGFNHQAQIFNGGYCDAYFQAAWCQPYNNIDLIMKWNNAWLSTKDCDGDNRLDRHLGYDSYIGSGAWITNHQSGKVDVNGKMRKWTYFVKVIAAPEDASASGGYWYTPEGIELGPVIWDDFAVIQEVYNDPSVGANGVLYKSPANPGLGNNQQNSTTDIK